MPRLNTNAEVFADVTEVGVMTDVAAGWSTTVATAAVAAGDTAVEVTDGSSIVDGDKVRIGDAPLLESGTVESGGGTANLVLVSGLGAAYAVGEAVVEVEDTQIGDLTDSGIDLSHEGGDQEIISGTQAGVYAYIANPNQSITMSFALLNTNLENWASVAGIPEGNILGAGTVADPYTLDVKPAVWATQTERVWYFTGARVDAAIVRIEANGAKVAAPEGTMTFVQGTPAEMPLALRIVHGYRVYLSS